MDHLRHQKYKNKQLKNNTLQLEKFLKRTNKEENIYKKTLDMIGTIG